MRNAIIFIIMSSFSILSYGQTINKIRIEHIGNIDKPFPVLELYNSATANTDVKSNVITIQDSFVFEQTLKYFNEKYVGKVDTAETNYGTFSISFYKNNKLQSIIFLNKEGAVYFLVNLHTYLRSDEKNKTIIDSMVRRLL